MRFKNCNLSFKTLTRSSLFFMGVHYFQNVVSLFILLEFSVVYFSEQPSGSEQLRNNLLYIGEVSLRSEGEGKQQS